MEIKWKTIEEKELSIINSWLSDDDKYNLCMNEKSWGQTAEDIGECLKNLDGGQFVNIIGYINEKPEVAVMFGIEHPKTLNLYNIAVSPDWRGFGVAKRVLTMLLKNDASVGIVMPYEKVKVSTRPGNVKMQCLLVKMEFSGKGFDGDYLVFEKQVTKTNENIKW